VRDSYLRQANTEPDRFVVLDTTRSLSAVQADVVALAQRLIDDNEH